MIVFELLLFIVGIWAIIIILGILGTIVWESLFEEKVMRFIDKIEDKLNAWKARFKAR